MRQPAGRRRSTGQPRLAGRRHAAGTHRRGRPASSPESSGLRFLPTGNYAFNARIELLRRAERSIDAQYYLLEDDTIGRSFLRALRDAAQRGVRVRLLVDDLYAGGDDALLAGPSWASSSTALRSAPTWSS